MTVVDGIGGVGVAVLLLAFALNATGKVPSDSRRYHAMNTVGAALACTASVMIDYLPFVVLEGAWSLVALFALVRGPRDAAGPPIG